MPTIRRNTDRKYTKIKLLFGAIVIPMILLLSTASVTVKAETTPESYDDGLYGADGKLKIAKCFTEGGQSFTAFLKSTIWSDSFAEGIVEPWNDVLVRNSCQGYDILGLVQQRDKLRAQIRDALLTCRNEKVPALKTAYYKTSVEIFYARNVVTGGVMKKTDADITTLHNTMIGKYVDKNKWFTADDFNVFLNELDVRYNQRKAAYRDQCDMTSWKDVKEKFEEFISGDFAKDIKKSGAQLERKADKIDDAWGDEKSWKEAAKSAGQFTINGQSPSDFGEEFMADWDKNDPFSKTNFPTTIQGAFENNSKADLVLRAQALEKEMSSRFQTLYGAGADVTIQEFMNSAFSLNQTVLDSFPLLDSLKQGAKMTDDRQCNG